MNWNDQLLRKLMATVHKPNDQADAITFACAVIMPGALDELDGEDVLILHRCRKMILSAFSIYLHDGRRNDWNEAMEAVKEDLAELGKDKEDTDGN